MSRGQNFSKFNARARTFLEADPAPAGDGDCAVGPCDETAVYRVPWPSVGGDVAYCGYHLARYREQHPELFDRVQAAVDDDLTAYATRGTRFLTFDAVPKSLFDETFDAIALLATGEALLEETDPDDTVAYVTVDRRLEEQSRIEVPRHRTGAFLESVEDRLGVHAWDDDVEAALRGGEVA